MRTSANILKVAISNVFFIIRRDKRIFLITTGLFIAFNLLLTTFVLLILWGSIDFIRINPFLYNLYLFLCSPNIAVDRKVLVLLETTLLEWGLQGVGFTTKWAVQFTFSEIMKVIITSMTLGALFTLVRFIKHNRSCCMVGRSYSKLISSSGLTTLFYGICGPVGLVACGTCGALSLPLLAMVLGLGSMIDLLSGFIPFVPIFANIVFIFFIIYIASKLNLATFRYREAPRSLTT
ncbi:MAG: hypothetical protein QW470_00335 [Candidatus Caldarchaeum sp.]